MEEEATTLHKHENIICEYSTYATKKDEKRLQCENRIFVDVSLVKYTSVSVLI